MTPFKLPDACIGGLYPEMNPPIGLDHHDTQSQTPASKPKPVWIRS